jgi:two-component system chemotaxis sensor kinase CheA
VAKDIYRYFRIEARELIDGLAQGALAIEKGSADAQVAPLLRITHTLKGAARVVKQGVIADSAHALEEVLIPLRESPRPATSAEVTSCLRLIDQMRTALDALDAPPQVAAAANPAGSVAQPALAVRVDSVETDALLEGLSSCGRTVSELTRDLGGLEELQGTSRSLAEVLALPAGSLGGRDLQRAGLDAATLEERLNGAQRSLAVGFQRLQRELIEVRLRVEQLRLQPLSTLFGPLERVLRDAAQELQRQVRWEAEGGEIGIDRAVLAVLAEALPHVVRNAVTHGVERPESRLAAGKPAVALVRMRVSRSGATVSILITDDGPGLDLEAVRAKARERGLTGAQQLQDDDAVIAALLRGGLSTSPAVSAVAGRGVGMDVVREALERLRGRILLRSRPGQGLTVELQVPVSLASARALIAQVGVSVVAIPLDAVSRTLRATAPEIVQTPLGEALVLEGRSIPLLALGHLIGAAVAPRGEIGRRLVLVVHGSGTDAALEVDRLLGTADITVQGFPPGVQPIPVLSGVGIDDAGSPRLVLNAAVAVAEVRAWAGAGPPAAMGVPGTKRLPILVIDDSLTTRTLEQSILESAGYTVDVATSAEEAMTMIERTRYGLFVVDVEMPGMDGFTFVQQTRADPVQRQVPAILVTSLSSAQARSRGAEVGAMAFIVKAEFDQRQLLDLIHGVLG